MQEVISVIIARCFFQLKIFPNRKIWKTLLLLKSRFQWNLIDVPNVFLKIAGSTSIPEKKLSESLLIREYLWAIILLGISNFFNLQPVTTGTNLENDLISINDTTVFLSCWNWGFGGCCEPVKQGVRVQVFPEKSLLEFFSNAFIVCFGAVVTNHFPCF